MARGARRAFLLVDPMLDLRALLPGAATTAAIGREVRRVHLSERFGTRVMLTGTVPINDQQFSTLRAGTGWSMLGTVLAVLVILWPALRSLWIIVAVAASLSAGFAVAAALGLLLVGSFNLISVAFAVPFVGLGADSGIQFGVRHRSERFRNDALRPALRSAASRAGVPLLLATVSTAAGFAFLVPTSYLGMAELGGIAGMGMVVAFLSTITLPPALLVVLKPPGEAERLGFGVLAPIDRVLQRRRFLVVGGTLATVVLAAPLPSRGCASTWRSPTCSRRTRLPCGRSGLSPPIPKWRWRRSTCRLPPWTRRDGLPTACGRFPPWHRRARSMRWCRPTRRPSCRSCSPSRVACCRRSPRAGASRP